MEAYPSLDAVADDLEWSDDEEYVQRGARQERDLLLLGSDIHVGGEPPEAGSGAGRKRKARGGIAFDERKLLTFGLALVATMRHRDDLVTAVGAVVADSASCDNEALASALLHVVPSYIVESCCEGNTVTHLQLIMQWFHEAFKLDNSAVHSPVLTAADMQGSGPITLYHVLHSRSGSEMQLTQLFVCLLRSLHYSTQLCVSVDPRPIRPSAHQDIYENLYRISRGMPPLPLVGDEEVDWKLYVRQQLRPQSHTKKKKMASAATVEAIDVDALSNETVPEAAAAERSLARPAGLPQALWSQYVSRQAHFERFASSGLLRPLQTKVWCEVALAAGPVHLDPAHNLVDYAASVEQYRRGRPLVYAVAVDGHGRVVDVTSRYNNRFHLVQKQRIDKGNYPLRWKHSAFASWWGEYLQSCGCVPEAIAAPPVRRAEVPAGAVAKPATIAAFKDHPRFVLQRHMSSGEIVRSDRRCCGLFNGEKYYKREDVCRVNTRRMWRREFREVLAGEQPVRMQTRKEMQPLRFYSEEQTREMQVAPVHEGVLPVNRYGNIEVWDGDERYVPAGATLISGGPRSAQKAAAVLGVPCAPAIFGFQLEGSSGRLLPRTGGVVVLAEHAEIVRDGARALNEETERKERQKEEERVVANWTKLVRSLLSRQKIRSKYGH